MLSHFITSAVRLRVAVIILVAMVAAIGIHSLRELRIDAVPDITNKQVQINTVAAALGPVEVEKLVTFPIESVLAGIPGLESTRSISRSGFSQVTVVFRESADIYFARQQVAERLSQAREGLPEGVEPQMGPLSTGLGEVFMWSVGFTHPFVVQKDGQPGWQADGSFITPEGEKLEDETSRSAYLRTVQDWIIKPQLRNVAGVAGIDSIGGYEKQYVVSPDAAKLAAYGISFGELADALEESSLAVGANFIERGGEAFLVKADARVRSLDEIARAVIATRGGVPVAVKDVASVAIGGGLRSGAASLNGEDAVIGTALMLLGENSRIVAKAVVARMVEVNRALPQGVEARPVYDRSNLVNATIATVAKNLTEGALLVIVILFLLLGNLRAAFIAALVIPLSMLMTATGMNALHVSGNLMSLGALDFGLIVDGAVIIVENCLRRLAEKQHAEGRLLTLQERLAEVSDATKEMIQPTVYGQAIILIVYAPLLTFSGIEGKMFTPMAITVMLALAAAFVLSVTFVPAMLAVLVRGRVSEQEGRFMGAARRFYLPLLSRSVRNPAPSILASVVIFIVSVGVFSFLGREFMPKLDERDLMVQALRIPSTSLDQSRKMQFDVEKAVTSLPEIAWMFSKTGTAEVASDPMPPSISDGFVILKPRDQWPDPGLSKADLVKKVEAKLAPLVGNNYEFTQPIEMRFNELIAGVRSDVGVKVYGDDLAVMTATAKQIEQVLRGVEGAADVRLEQTDGFPTFDVAFNRDAIANHGLSVRDVATTLEAALGGREAGLLFEGDRRFDIVVRLADRARYDLDAIGALPVMLPADANGHRASIPLRELARFSFTEGLNQISRENGKRSIVVQANVRGRDLGSFVTDAQNRIAGSVQLPAGIWIDWGGQFENLQTAQARLMVVVPLAFLAIFGLLYAGLGGVRPAVIVFSAVPLALAGGVMTLALRGMPFSISAAVGFIALSGVAVLNGLVMMTSIQKRLAMGLSFDTAIIEGAAERLRPVLMTALVAALGFVPMAIASGTGAEVQKPLATVVIGGLITATALTLLVLPAMSKLILRSRKPG